MKCAAFDIAENLSASLFVYIYIYKDIHSLTSLMKKKKKKYLSPGDVNSAATTEMLRDVFTRLQFLLSVLAVSSWYKLIYF